MKSKFSKPKASTSDSTEITHKQVQKICELMASILKLSTVDSNQSFLEAGGHSLQAMVLKYRLETYFNVELSYSEVLKCGSPKHLSQLISKLPKRKESQVAVSSLSSKYSGNKIKANDAQKLIYFATLSHIEPRAYNIPILLQLKKELSISKIHAGLIATCKHHPALMSSFVVENGELFQQLNTVNQVPFHILNVFPDDLNQAMIDFAQPFSLANGPLVRAGLFDDGSEHYHLLIDFHHLVMDGLSLEVFLKDFNTFLTDGRFSTHLDYEDAVISVDSIPQDSMLWKKADNYWNDLLRTPLRNQQLPGKAVKFFRKSSAGKQLQVPLSKDLIKNAQIFCNSHRSTLHSFFLAVLNILLSKLTYEEEILIGVPSNGRISHESEGVVGMFVKTLPSRHQVFGNLRFSDFLTEVHSQSLKRLDYQFYPIQEKDTGKLDQSSFKYNVVYTTQRFNLDLKKIGRVKPFYYPFAHFPLLFSLIENQSSFDLVIEYDIEQFESETIQSYAHSFIHLCNQILMGEEREIHSLSLLSDEDSLFITNRFNPFNSKANQLAIQEQSRLGNEGTLITKFRKIAKINPDRIAVQSFNKKISYKELDELTDRIAYILREEGVATGQTVAVLAEREINYVVAILSILKIGAAYVPLDPDYPIIRLDAMLKTAECNYCLNLQKKALSLSVKTLAWSNIFKKAKLYKDFQAPIQVEIDTNSRAYVMFTSGSTGKPKGVGISHRNILRLVETNNIVPLSENTKILLTGSPSFDATTYEIWGPLLNGGTVALIDKMTLLDSRLLSKAIVHFETNTMWMTAPLFARMVYENPRLFQGINYLIVGGDVVSPEAVRLVQETTPEVIVVNGYGPTENTTFSTFYLIPHGVTNCAIPIGRPLVKSTAYVMDKGGNLLPPTALGELYVGGEGVSEGYVNDPMNISRQKFIEYQWPDGKIEYLYRTGDLAYWDSKGLIHLLGRIDSQVKVRGLRVEPNEIQGLLVQHPDIQNAYVTLAKEQEVEGLAAYIIFNNPVNMDGVITFLQDNLPSHMIPTFYLEVDSLPLNINGKISKEQLPKGLKVLRRTSQPQLAQSLSEEEREISNIWSELFRIESIGLDDSFFGIGGDSIKVVALASRLEKIYKLRPSIASLYSLNTIRKQADYFANLKNIENKNTDVSTSQSASQESDLNCRVKASEAQKRLFVLDQVTSGRAPYLIPILFKFNGKLDLYRLKNAWIALRQRHQFLRSRFVMDIDQSTLWIELQSGDSQETLSVFNGIQDSQLSEWLADRLDSFTLSDCGVARLDILETDQDEFYLAFTFHHIAVDGASVEIILEDLATYYRGEPLPPLEISSFEFWENREQLLKTKVANSYWSNLLAQSTSEIQLPNDFPRTAQPQTQGETVYLPLSHEIRSRMNEIAQNNNVTPFMVYLAAFTVLLNRYSRQKDFNLGTVANGRLEAKSVRLVGMLVNTLPLKIQIDPDWKFSYLLELITKEVLSGLDHQEFSFEDLVIELKSERESFRNPLFNVLFSRIVSGPLPSFGPEASIQKQDWNYPTAKFDLTLFVLEEADCSRVAVEFASDVLVRASAERILNHYLKILESIMIDSDKPIKAISFLPESERQQVLHTFNDTSVPYNRECLIHQLFELQVSKTPNALAVEQGTVSYTYLELEMRANQLASALRKSGVTQGVPVLVIADRTPEMIVAVLAVLKAGGFYVPVETDIPEQRLISILETLQISHALTDQTTLLKSKIDDPKFNIIKKIICIDSDLSQESSNRLLPVTGSQDLAYVIFTSGSTGFPKGVKVAHRPVINLIEWVNRRYTVSGHDKLLFITSLCFDLSVYDIFGILAAGGTIRVASYNEIKDPQHLAQILKEEKITFWDSAPGAMQQILQVIKPNLVFPYLRLVFLSGDWVPVSVPGALKKISPEILVVALGGATEATVWSNYFEVQEDCSNWESIPYGNPIQNARYYILDELNQPTPIGVPGRLFIGGECLAEGYAGQSELTEDRFIKDPFSNTTRAVMYHTGDLACWRPDGKMRFLGREDHQVKIRGYRVELGDITHSLKQYPAIREAITLAQSDPAGQKSLVAYVLCHSQISSHELSNFLAARLPAYMIPSWYCFLEEFPVTRNGKFDLKSLPSIPEIISRQNEDIKEHNQATSRMMNEIEQHIHNLWCQILGQAVVPMDVSFHRAGGNSLLLVRLHTLLEAEWPGFFTIPDLFVIATISAQANHVINRGGLKLSTLEESKSSQSEVLDTRRLQPSNEPIAIIGMAGKWPGADNLINFWKLNMEGIPQTRPFPISRQKKVQNTMKNSRASSMQVGAFFDHIDEFDPEFFGINVREAELMDPVQRQFLSMAWLAFEDARYPLSTLKGQSVGIYVGYCVGSEDLTYGQLIRENYPDLYPMAFTGNLPPIIAGRLSYLYDLRGPSLVIDTACSSSLVAVHQACQALYQNDCEMALVGGVKLHLLPLDSHDSIGIESTDGMTRSFAGGASGTGIGEGVAAIVLKPLSKALQDNDEIYATIVGTACNQDGLTSGLTVPSTLAQQEVIEQAWTKAEKHCDQNLGDFHLQIGYVEAHGTGTQLGDPIEFQALSHVFKKRSPNLRQHCAVGSAKSLVGHLDSAAGITGLIRAALMLKKEIILPSLHFIQPNDKIDYLSSALYVNDLPTQWPEGRHYCGISAFGMSGTNCHVVLKKPPMVERMKARHISDFSNETGVVMLSAHSLESLRQYIKILRTHLIDDRPLFGALLSSLSRRQHFEFRIALLSNSTENTVQLLNEILVAWPNLEKVENCVASFAEMSLGEIARSRHIERAYQLAQKYVRKDVLDWSSIYRQFTAHHLPGYVFDARELWFASESPSAPEQEDSKPSNKDNAEQTARSLWKSILGTSHISDDVDFFQGGGDSLRATFFISRLSNVLGLKINPAQLWKTPTLKSLLEYIRTISQETQESSYRLEATKTLPSYPLTPSQKYIYVHSILNNDVLYNVPIGLKFIGPLNLELLKKHLISVIEADPVFSLTFESHHGKVVQTLRTKDVKDLDISSRLQFEIFKYPQTLGKDESFLQKIMATFIRPFNICDGPLARFAVIKKSDQEHILLMDFHHLIMDGVSVSIFVKRLYQAYKEGRVADTEFTFTDFISAWEKQQAQNGFEKHFQHWETQLKTKKGGIIHRLGRSSNSVVGSRYTILLPQELSQSLILFARNSGHGLFATLAATYALGLKNMFNQNDFNIGTPMSGRLLNGMENLLGMFVNLYPIPIEFSNQSDDETQLDTLMSEIRSWLAEAIQFQDFPMKLVQTETTEETDNSKFNVMFALQNMDISPTTIQDDLNATPIPFYDLPWNVAKFDLSLYAMEVDQSINLSFEYQNEVLSQEDILQLSKIMEEILYKLLKRSRR